MHKPHHGSKGLSKNSDLSFAGKKTLVPGGKYALTLSMHMAMTTMITGVFFQADSLAQVAQLSNVGDTVPGFIIDGSDEALIRLGFSSAGDINGDGFDDLWHVDPFADPNGRDSGQAIVIFGFEPGDSNTLAVSDLDGGNGFIINGASSYDRLGSGFNGVGDVNGDGFDDIILSEIFSPGLNGAGISYLILGQQNFNSVLEISAPANVNITVFAGINGDDRTGAVSRGGDINGDGIEDFIIGAGGFDANMVNEGRSYVIFGNTNGFGSTFDLSNINGTNGFVIDGIDPGDAAGNYVDIGSDINGDSISDIIISASNADPNGNASGQAYVVFGSTSVFSSPLELSMLDGMNGFTVNGPDTFNGSGLRASGINDFNGDGLRDLMINLPSFGVDVGRTYVIFGRSGMHDATIELSSLPDNQGFRIDGSDGGHRWASNRQAGDINDDGLEDILMGSPVVAERDSYVLFGGSESVIPVININSLNETNSLVIRESGSLNVAAHNIVGDVSGDGVADLSFGVPFFASDDTDFGRNYIIFGNEDLKAILLNGFESVTLN